MIEDSEVLVLKNRYKILLKKQIGQGSFGTVHECLDLQNENPDKQICAKITNIHRDPSTQREMAMLLKLKTVALGNPNIVGVVDVLVHDQQFILILEKCQGDLMDLIKEKRKLSRNFSPAEALEIIKQIINGYKVLLAHNIIHRDLKPQNILYLNDTYKIADFGFARTADPYNIHTKLGTPRYSAPQLFFDVQYSNKADIYSLGIIFYQLIFGDFPFSGETNIELRENILKTKYAPIKVNQALPQVFNQQFQEDNSIPILIEKMLMYSEEDRIDWRGLINHKLIVNFNSNLQENQISNKNINLLQLKQTNFYYPCFQQPIQHQLDQDQKNAILIAIIGQELFQYMNSLQQFPKEILYIRNKLFNISYYFLDLALSKQQNNFIQGQFKSIEKNLQNEFEAYQLNCYSKYLPTKEKMIDQIKDVQQLMSMGVFKYQKEKNYNLYYLQLIFKLLYFAQNVTETNIYDVILQIEKNQNDKQFIVNYLDQNWK